MSADSRFWSSRQPRHRHVKLRSPRRLTFLYFRPRRFHLVGHSDISVRYFLTFGDHAAAALLRCLSSSLQLIEYDGAATVLSLSRSRPPWLYRLSLE
jgi:hypothetical protein